jgi:hypothetical protein
MGWTMGWTGFATPSTTFYFIETAANLQREGTGCKPVPAQKILKILKLRLEAMRDQILIQTRK